MPLVVATPGTCEAIAWTRRGIGWKPPLSARTMIWAVTRRLIAPSMDALRPAVKTATKTTRPRPTISAAAVSAVRAGFRWAFSRASWPTTGESRSSGSPMAAAIGRTMYLATRARPMKSSTAPPPIPSSLSAAGPEPKRP